ncbi:MAG TPA: DUF1353 domain-containing protein, partial [Thermoanaerobaculia bacterium]|nr:DUF1353 domain-containing protein [Thermoanaerobaculia bacterium]
MKWRNREVWRKNLMIIWISSLRNPSQCRSFLLTRYGFKPLLVCLCLLSLLGTGCASARYQSTKPGKLQGKLIVQWIEPDEFLFIPDPESPLSFIRFNGDKITPGKMMTDGGSIPRPLWILRSYSPWGYAPAFIVHDWLFVMKHCQIPGNEKYNVHDAALVLAEVMKTIMVTGKVAVDRPTLWSIYSAVNSPIAGNLWDKGACIPPPPGLTHKKPILEYELV